MTRILLAFAVLLSAGVGCAARKTAAPGAAAATVQEVPAGVDAGTHTPEGPVIVRLAGRNHATITVTSSPDGPRYSAHEADGRAIVRGATLDELQASHPELAQFVTPGIAVHADMDPTSADLPGLREKVIVPRGETVDSFEFDSRR